jgi:hypothetical protein
MLPVKAGALRIALAHTATDAEIIGVIDADYVVSSNWLKDLAPVFANPKVGLVQAPQDHRDAARSVTHNAMNGEYAGFFDIGMVQRNEINAIIVHGTMCLIRREALNAAGGWSSDTICEDTYLGLTILELGWETHYNKRYGLGLLPDNFQQFKRQRYRWAMAGCRSSRSIGGGFCPVAVSSRRNRGASSHWRLAQLAGLESIGVLVASAQSDLGAVCRRYRIASGQDPHAAIIISFAVSMLHFLAPIACVAIPTSQKVGAVAPRCRCSGQWRAPSASAL